MEPKQKQAIIMNSLLQHAMEIINTGDYAMRVQHTMDVFQSTDVLQFVLSDDELIAKFTEWTMKDGKRIETARKEFNLDLTKMDTRKNAKDNLTVILESLTDYYHLHSSDLGVFAAFIKEMYRGESDLSKSFLAEVTKVHDE